MFEIFLAMMAVAAQSAGDVSEPAPAGMDSAASSGAAATTAAPQAEQQETAPSFLAPAPADQPTSPAFLAPKAGEKTSEPSFLAPAGSALVAEPQVPSGKFTTAVEVKPILEATRGNWVSVREFNGQDLVYVTHLWSWRCGLLEMKVGVNGNPPIPWPLPECHMDLAAPNSMLEEDGLPYRGFGLKTVSQIEVQLTFDDLTTASAIYDRGGIMIP